MIATYECNTIRIPHFQRQQQQERLHTIKAAIYKVAQEEIVGGGTLAADTKQFLQVVELAVDVAADLNARGERRERRREQERYGVSAGMAGEACGWRWLWWLDGLCVVC